MRRLKIKMRLRKWNDNNKGANHKTLLQPVLITFQNCLLNAVLLQFLNTLGIKISCTDDLYTFVAYRSKQLFLSKNGVANRRSSISISVYSNQFPKRLVRFLKMMFHLKEKPPESLFLIFMTVELLFACKMQQWRNILIYCEYELMKSENVIF